jgi:hypothetical protein
MGAAARISGREEALEPACERRKRQALLGLALPSRYATAPLRTLPDGIRKSYLNRHVGLHP